MSYLKWLITTLCLILILSVVIVAANFVIDHHAVRLSLFSGKKEFHQSFYPDGINQHMFNPEFVFRNPRKFDCFLFGSSRTAAFHVEKIPTGKFFNMSYSSGIPAQHLAILKAFLRKGVKIKSVLIGLDEFCFNLPGSDNQKSLIRIMHPEAGGPSQWEIFLMYFFRKPGLQELTLWKNRVLSGQMKGRIILDEQGVNLGWWEKEQTIEKGGRPIFDFTIKKYEPIVYDPRKMDEAFAVIESIIALSRTHHFSLTFFVTPLYTQLYLNNAESLLTVKERLAKLTDFWDFSGFNSVTTNALNYYEESHYRYRVGDMIIDRLYGNASVKAPPDFGEWVTRQNIHRHLDKQKQELETYLEAQHLR